MSVTRWMLRNLGLVPDYFKTQYMCKKVVFMDQYSLEFVPDRFKTEEICKEAVHRKPYTLRYVPNHLKTQEMRDEALHIIYPDEYREKAYAISQLALLSCGHESFL